MFKLTTSKPSPIRGTIRTNKPLSLGPITDADGKRWDILCYGMDEDGWWVIAVSMHPYYTDMSGAHYRLVSQRREPYRVEKCT